MSDRTIRTVNGKTYRSSCYVNSVQSPGERKEKYAYLLSIGFSAGQARRWRDWHWSRIRTLVTNYGKGGKAMKMRNVLEKLRLRREQFDRLDSQVKASRKRPGSMKKG